MYGSFAWTLDSAGDLNADGFDDVIVGMQSYDNGHAYVFLGPIVGDITATSAEAIWAQEEYGDYGGKAVGGDFDFDADGTPDYVMGSYYASTGSSYEVGAAYLVYGPGTGIDSNMSDADVKFYGSTSYAYFGDSLSTLGDTNGDGADDLAVGAWQNSSGYGSVYVFGGGSLGGEVSVSAADATITGPSSYQYFGRAISRADDFNNDGYGDVVAVAPYGHSGYGAAYVLLGPVTSGSVSTVAQAELYGEYPYGMTTNNSGGVDGAGDINIDGYSDVLVGTPYYSAGGGVYNSGAGYVVYGPQTGSVSLANARCAIPGMVSNDQAGYDMAFVGDQTGDDSAEVLVGGPYAGGYYGTAWMVYGDRL
jgi:hypothetical protein